MQGSMFRSSRIVRRRKNRLFVSEMLNRIADEGVDNRAYFIRGSPGEYRGSQIVGVVEQTLVLCVHHAVAGKGVTIGIVPGEPFD